MRSRLKMIALTVAISVCAGSFAADPAPADAAAKPATAALGQAAPAFSLQDSNGKTVSLADYKGKVVVLEWINQDCPIDSRVIDSKFISMVYDKFKDKVVWLAIDSTSFHVKGDYDKTIARWKLPYPILSDASGTVGHMYKAQTTPHMYIINTDGKLVYIGGIDNDPEGTNPRRVNYVDTALTEIFQGKPVSVSESKPYGCAVKYAN